MTYETYTASYKGGDFNYGVLRQSGYSNCKTVVLLGMDLDTTLTAPTLNEVGTRLVDQGWAALSLDIPCHGAWLFEGAQAGLNGWFDLCTAGENFVAQFVGRVNAMLNHARSTGLAHAHRHAVVGVSRGGFLALHLAQADVIGTVVGISPVTKLTRLSEFAGYTGDEPFPLDPKVLRWYSGNMSISNRDTRVGTWDVADLYKCITEAQIAVGKKQWKLVIGAVDGDGHTQLTGSHEEAANWIAARVQ